MKTAWHFSPHTPTGHLFNPLSGEHFNQGAVGDSDWEAGESLVREAIQNSLDAAADDGVVDVRLTVSPRGALTAGAAARWFESLWPHLRARGCKFAKLSLRPEACGYLVVEDFGTTGLRGDVQQWKSPYVAYLAHRDDPARVEALLSEPPTVSTSEIFRELVESPLLGCKSAVGVARAIYLTPGAAKLRRGAGVKGAGGARRLLTALMQFDPTFDLHTIPESSLLTLLPSEFRRPAERTDRRGNYGAPALGV